MSRWIKAFLYGGIVGALVWISGNEYFNITKSCPANMVKVRGYNGGAVCVTGTFAGDAK